MDPRDASASKKSIEEIENSRILFKSSITHKSWVVDEYIADMLIFGSWVSVILSYYEISH